MLSNLNYKASETEIIRPFDTIDGYFRHVGVRLKKELDFFNDEKIYLDDDQELNLIEINFQNLSISDFVDLNIEKENVKISIILKDRNIKENRVLYNEKIDFFENKTFNIFNDINYNLDLADFELLIILTEQNNNNILSLKKFVFSKLKQKIDIPKQYMPPSFFEEQGLAKDTVWYVNWIGSDLNKSLSELMIICLNDKFRLNIESMNDEESSLFQCQMSAAIMFDIFYPVIIKNNELSGQNYLALEQVKDFMLSKINISDEELSVLIEKENFHSILSSWCLNFQKLNKEIVKLP